MVKIRASWTIIVSLFAVGALLAVVGIYDAATRCAPPTFIEVTAATGEKAAIRSSAVTIVFEGGDRKIGDKPVKSVLWTGNVSTSLSDDIKDLKKKLCIGE